MNAQRQQSVGQSGELSCIWRFKLSKLKLALNSLSVMIFRWCDSWLFSANNLYPLFVSLHHLQFWHPYFLIPKYHQYFSTYVLHQFIVCVIMLCDNLHQWIFISGYYVAYNSFLTHVQSDRFMYINHIFTIKLPSIEIPLKSFTSNANRLFPSTLSNMYFNWKMFSKASVMNEKTGGDN